MDGVGRPILALHGFGGTPREVDLVLDAAAELGRPGHSPLLPGHGTDAADLSRRTFEDWTDAAEAALEDLGRRHAEPAIVCGLSMGALLTLHLAATRPSRVHAIVLISNAAWLTRPFPELALRLVDALHLADFSVPKVGADIADPEARRTHLTYDTQPVHTAVRVLRAGERLRQPDVLAAIRCPALVLHGARDRVCPASNATRIAERLGSSDRTVRIFPRSRHILTRDLERDAVKREIREFVERV